MIVVTGAAGFIASVLVGALNDKGHLDLMLVDHFDREDKMKNLDKKHYLHLMNRDEFIAWFSQNALEVDFVFHLGARTDTTEFNTAIFDELNLNYSKAIWNVCTEHQIPLIYASSAATYGNGEFGYDDRHDIVNQLKPLNPYGESKNDFDKWVLAQEKQPPFWSGLKFFNVYGPNEFHKGRMASVVFHAYHQIKENGEMKLFRSHRPDFADGGQLRDFVYVKDVIEVMLFLQEYEAESGLYNLGTGVARSFLDLANAVFAAMKLEPNISFIDTPLDIREKYQYFTEANMQKLADQGYDIPFYDLETGIEDYVQQFLMAEDYY